MAMILRIALALMIACCGGAIAQERPPAAPDRIPDKPQAREFLGPPAPPQWWQDSETPQELASCRLALAMLGTVYETQPTILDPQNPQCGIANPLRVDQIIPGVTLEGGAIMRCATARALALWTSEFVMPAAATLPDAPRVTAMQLGSTYGCRNRIGTGQDAPKISQHALGNAIDITAIEFDTGASLPVVPRQDTGDRAEAFQRTIRASACLYFSTVLGPGSNAAHDDHLHLDIAKRRGDWRLCQ